MLVIRPTESCLLEITPDTLPYECKLPPSRGIPPQAAIDRLAHCRHWLSEGEGRAPKPDWDLLNEGVHLHNQSFEENEDD